MLGKRVFAGMLTAVMLVSSSKFYTVSTFAKAPVVETMGEVSEPEGQAEEAVTEDTAAESELVKQEEELKKDEIENSKKGEASETGEESAVTEEKETESEIKPADESAQEDESVQVGEDARKAEENAGVEADDPEMTLENSSTDIADKQNADKSSHVSWDIDADGKLTVIGNGEFAEPSGDKGNSKAPWLSQADSIKSAEIDLTGTIDAGNMFSGCGNLRNLDLSKFDTSQVTNTSGMFSGCSSLAVIYTPCNNAAEIPLPKGADSDMWYLCDGTEITVIPEGLSYSIVIMKNEIPAVPAVAAAKTKTIYDCGDTLNIDDLKVYYYDEKGAVHKVAEGYSTNADTIDMNTAGRKALEITYDGMTAEVEITVGNDTAAFIGVRKNRSASGGLQAAYHTQDEIRAFLVNSTASPGDETTYAEEPGVTAPYRAGALSDETLESALGLLNQIRYIAGVSYDVGLSDAYNKAAQAASVVNAANDSLSHYPAKPSGMDDDLYHLGCNGAGQSNIAKCGTVNESLMLYMSDSDDSNIDGLGHRRWLLYPLMKAAGFGMAESYTATYAHDANGSSGDVQRVAWPAQNMPVDYFNRYPYYSDAWSVSLGEDVKKSEIQVTLTRTNDGTVWKFSDGESDGYFNVDEVALANYGTPGCVIFRPKNVEAYNDGDTFDVEITRNGEAYLNYSVHFFDQRMPVSISGITMEDKVYDGESSPYTGTPVVKDASGHIYKEDVKLLYEGVDENSYYKSYDAPTEVGTYKLSFGDADSYKYKLEDEDAYTFRIEPREVTITAGSAEIAVGGTLPSYSSDISIDIDGLIGEDKVGGVRWEYSEKNISTDVEGRYEIIPRMVNETPLKNYSIKYVNGTLSVVRHGTVNQISWEIDHDWKLTIKGTGEYQKEEDLEYADVAPPWQSRLVQSAEVDISGITSLGSMFWGCHKLKSVDLSKLDTSRVKNMGGMFTGCNQLESLDLSGFDTSQVTSMYWMFRGCSRLRSLDVSGFDTSNVQYMEGIFAECSGLWNLDLSSFNISKAKNLREMFYYCSGLRDLDLSGFDTSNIRNMHSMFYYCSNLNDLNVSGFDTSEVTDMGKMFYGCRGLKSLGLGSFDMSKVTDANDMFYGCDGLSYLDAPSNCPAGITLPGGESEQWYDENGAAYAELPAGLAASVDLYKNGYPGDGTGKVKKVLRISGVSIEDKIYDGNPISYSGQAVAETMSGSAVSDVAIHYLYSGTMENGKYYAETEQAPKQAGYYRLSVEVADNDRYTGQKEYRFTIRQKEITIEAPSLTVKAGRPAPALTGLTCEVSGMLDGDTLTKQPQLKYNSENINTAAGGSYEIIPYGANAGMNYEILYKNGILTIVSSAGSKTYTVTFDGTGREDIAEGTPGEAEEGTAYTFTLVKLEGFTYTVTATMGGEPVTLGNDESGAVYTVPSVSADLVITVNKTAGQSPEQPSEPEKKIYTVTFNGTGKEDVSRETVYEVKEGADYTFQLVKSEGWTYTVAAVMGGENITPISDASGAVYTIPDVRADLVITVNKTANQSPEQPGDETGLKIRLADENDKKIVYTGTAVRPEIRISYNGRQLTPGTDYTVKYVNNVKVGTAKIMVTGKGSFGRTNNKTNFEIVPRDIADAVLCSAAKDKGGEETLILADGSKLAPALYFNNIRLTNKDYVIKDADGRNIMGRKLGNADNNTTVTIEGKSGGNFTGSRMVTLNIVDKKNLIRFAVTVDKTKLNTLTYDGGRHYIHEIDGALTVTAKDAAGTNMVYGRDYDIVYPSDLINAGTKNFTVVGMGAYTGNIRKSYTIMPVKDEAFCVSFDGVSVADNKIRVPFTFTGAGVNFNSRLAVMDHTGAVLTEGRDYKLSYRGNKKAGQNAECVITFLGNYKGHAKRAISFEIEKADIGEMEVVIADQAYKGKEGIYKSVPYIIEDKDKTNALVKASNYKVTYYTENPEDNAGAAQMKGKNKVGAGAVVWVKLEAKGNNYSGTKIVSYKVREAQDLSRARITFQDAGGSTVKKISYTGSRITGKQIKAVVDGVAVDNDAIDIEAVYVNNVNKGRATVIIKGKDMDGCRYAGCRTATFSITARNLD